jgi:hypothetical protein
MLDLAENLGARLELEKTAIDRNFFLNVSRLIGQFQAYFYTILCNL